MFRFPFLQMTYDALAPPVGKSTGSFSGMGLVGPTLGRIPVQAICPPPYSVDRLFFIIPAGPADSETP